MKMVNLCPHPIRVVVGPTDDDVEVLAPAPKGAPARAEEVIVERTTLDNGQEVELFKLGHSVNLPDPQPDTVFVVSAMVMSSLIAYGVQRIDVVSPNTGSTAIRKDGQVWAVRGWRRLVA